MLIIVIDSSAKQSRQTINKVNNKSEKAHVENTYINYLLSIINILFEYIRIIMLGGFVNLVKLLI